MKHIREQAKSSQMARLRKLGAQGSLKWAKHAEHERRKYAAGGAVSGYAEGGEIGGAPARPNLGKSGRSKGKGKKAGAVTVNVISLGKDGAGPMGGPPPMMGPPGGPPRPPMAGPPPGPPMPPPGGGPGGPPMPPPGMRKHGGRVGFKRGGKVARRKGKEEGGRISEDSKREVERLRGEASKQNGLGAMSSATALGLLLTRNPLTRGLAPKRAAIQRGITDGLTGSNATLAGHSLYSKNKANVEAERIEKGQAEPGKEDRKFGGRAKMKRAKR